MATHRLAVIATSRSSDLHRLVERREQPLGHGHGVARDTGTRQQHRELIAAGARPGDTGACSGGQPGGHGAEQHLTGAVAKTVVDDLEGVEVHEQHSQAVTGGAGGLVRVFQPIEKEGTVGQSGQVSS